MLDAAILRKDEKRQAYWQGQLKPGDTGYVIFRVCDYVYSSLHGRQCSVALNNAPLASNFLLKDYIIGRMQ